MTKEHFILAFFWVVFCVLHSVFASLSFKKRASAFMGKAYHYYRLLYTLFAFVTLIAVVYYQLQMESPYLYRPAVFTYAGGIIVAIAGLIIMGICIKKYFLSLSDLKSLFQEGPKNSLMISGIHNYVRHPLYSGTFIFIWGFFIIFPYLSLLISNIIITTYTLLGIELEEQKLEAEFGNDYKTYKQKVPKLIPLFGQKGHMYNSSPK